MRKTLYRDLFFFVKQETGYQKLSNFWTLVMSAGTEFQKFLAMLLTMLQTPINTNMLVCEHIYVFNMFHLNIVPHRLGRCDTNQITRDILSFIYPLTGSATSFWFHCYNKNWKSLTCPSTTKCNRKFTKISFHVHFLTSSYKILQRS